jgi:hypothetical protein
MTERAALDAAHWERILGASADRFGVDASAPAIAAAETFRAGGGSRLLEFGAGQGRDTLFSPRRALKSSRSTTPTAESRRSRARPPSRI